MMMIIYVLFFFSGEIYILSTSFASPAKPFGKIYRLVDPIR